MRPIHSLPVVLVVAALAGCGGGGGGSDTTNGSAAPPPAKTQSQSTDPQTQTQTQTKTRAPAANDAAGAKVFASAGCVSCHTLKAAGSTGTVGPNLDDLKPDFATVQHQVQNGGGGMPAFSGQLSSAQIDAVARYVSDNAGR